MHCATWEYFGWLDVISCFPSTLMIYKGEMNALVWLGCRATRISITPHTQPLLFRTQNPYRPTKQLQSLFHVVPSLSIGADDTTVSVTSAGVSSFSAPSPFMGFSVVAVIGSLLFGVKRCLISVRWGCRPVKDLLGFCVSTVWTQLCYWSGHLPTIESCTCTSLLS